MSKGKSKSIVVLAILALLSPVFWQVPSILKEKNLAISPVWQVSQFETADINQTRGWHQTSFEKALAKIAWNRPVIAGEKLFKNTLILIDPNLYFFGEHPRERLEHQAREKLLFINLPFLLWGLYLLLPNKKWSSIFTGSVVLFAALGLTNNLAGLVLSAVLLYPVSLAALKLFQTKPVWFCAYSALSIFSFIHWFINYV